MAKAKHIRGIQCDAPAAEAIGRVLKTRMEEMCAFRERALDWSDPEGIHDMRVASRRLRSALRDFMPQLSRRRLSASLQEIKTVADALGDVRDQDVAILSLNKLAAKAPPEVLPGIQTLLNLRGIKRDGIRARLVPLLNQERIAQLQANFVAALEEVLRNKEVKRSKQTAQAAPITTYRDVARQTISQRLKELEKLSDALYHPLKAKPLHELRIGAKRLRYAMELFAQCWGRPMALLAKKVASLQSELGNLHDCDVWIVDFGDELLKARKQTSAEESGDNQDVASVWLLNHYVKQRTKYFRNALSRWREWDTHDLGGQLHRIIQQDVEPAVTRGEGSVVATKTVGLPSESEI